MAGSWVRFLVLPILVVAAVRAGKASFVVGVSVFGASMVVLYLASTLYHSITHEGAKRVARVVLMTMPILSLLMEVLSMQGGYELLPSIFRWL